MAPDVSVDLPAFVYSRPKNLSDLAEALARPGACIYAGGTDLLVALSERRPWDRFVHEVVDVKALGVAKGIRTEGDQLRVGALVTTAELAASG